MRCGARRAAAAATGLEALHCTLDELRYDGSTGAFVDTFVAKHSGGMNHPYGILFGPHDGDLYISTGSAGGRCVSTYVCTSRATT